MVSRGMTGIFYEAIDMGSIPITAPLFKDRYSLITGFTNGFLRLGSVCTFVLSPYMERNYGLPAAIWLSCVVGLTQSVCIVGMVFLLHKLKLDPANPPLLGPVGDHKRNSSNSLLMPAGGIAADSVSPADTPPPPAARRHLSRQISDHLLTRVRQAKDLPRRFWIYVGTGMLVYTALVPLYSVGSGILQRKYNLDTRTADSLMLIPEAAIAFVAPVLGLMVDTWTVQDRVVRMSISLAFFVPTFMTLGFNSAAGFAYTAMFALGVFWSLFNSIFWGLVGMMCNSPGNVGLSVGILGCALNLGPSILLLLIGALQGRVDSGYSDVIVMCIFATLSGSASIAAYILLREIDAQGDPFFGQDSESDTAGDSRMERLKAAGSSNSLLSSSRNRRRYESFEEVMRKQKMAGIR
eukprot:CAMPEP_0170192248 /NCGR_PEP_ID=MMETSP0040_2-20121228/53689_1 /TAXON_ID=641309 /ORGANISM="Lotharella oceanica, Strain CCMP622" /LENGTH=407 /DNA_ID=CAMNT_0010440551 /DNA_START=143 /DNA_END=1366 /DNA_ORIENTATION=+